MKGMPKKMWRDYAIALRNRGFDACVEAHGINAVQYPRRQAARKERGETLREIANEIDEMLDKVRIV